MPNQKQKKPKKPTKRVINFGMCSYVDPCSSDKCQMLVQYIIDRGNLIQDVKTRYNEIVYFNNKETAEKYEQRYKKSKSKIRHDLEYQICATGATAYNAELTANKLLSTFFVGKTK